MNGYLSDPPGIPMYMELTKLKSTGLVIYRCLRGSSALEGWHLHKRESLSVCSKKAGFRWQEAVSLEFDWRWVVKALRKVKIVPVWVRHFNLPLVEALFDVVEQLFAAQGGAAVVLPGWRRTKLMRSPLIRHGFHYGLEAQRLALDVRAVTAAAAMAPATAAVAATAATAATDVTTATTATAIIATSAARAPTRAPAPTSVAQTTTRDTTSPFAARTRAAAASSPARTTVAPTGAPTGAPTTTTTATVAGGGATAATVTAAAAPAATAIAAAAPAAQPPTTVAMGASATFPPHAPTMTAHAAHRISEAAFLAARMGVAHPVHARRTPGDVTMLLQDRRLLARPMELSHRALSNGLLMTRREAGAFAEGIDNEEAARVALLAAGRRHLQQGLWTQVPGAPVAPPPLLGRTIGTMELPGPWPVMGLIARAPEPPITSVSADETRKRKAREKQARKRLDPGFCDRERANKRDQYKRRRGGGGGGGSGGRGRGRGGGGGGGEGGVGGEAAAAAGGS